MREPVVKARFFNQNLNLIESSAEGVSDLCHSPTDWLILTDERSSRMSQKLHPVHSVVRAYQRVRDGRDLALIQPLDSGLSKAWASGFPQHSPPTTEIMKIGPVPARYALEMTCSRLTISLRASETEPTHI